MHTRTRMIAPVEALPGREIPMELEPLHYVKQVSMLPPYPAGLEIAYFAMGCFWGVERLFWEQPGVYVTGVGCQGGFTPNPTYEEVCSGYTGHAESVRVVFDPKVISYTALLKLFWEHHDPAQGARQGNDIGTQYRSMILTCSEHQQQEAIQSRDHYQSAIWAYNDSRTITTEIAVAHDFYFAEQHHQQYLAKNPDGYCNLGGIGICLPTR